MKNPISATKRTQVTHSGVLSSFLLIAELRFKPRDFRFLERCILQAEHDEHFVRDVAFSSDVPFAREWEHITSLRPTGATSLWRSHNITCPQEETPLYEYQLFRGEILRFFNRK